MMRNNKYRIESKNYANIFLNMIQTIHKIAKINTALIIWCIQYNLKLKIL